jgi:hypothetical protein
MNDTEAGSGPLARALHDYRRLMDLRDPRSDSYPLMGSVWPTVAICFAYVYFVKVLGPR